MLKNYILYKVNPWLVLDYYLAEIVYQYPNTHTYSIFFEFKKALFLEHLYLHQISYIQKLAVEKILKQSIVILIQVTYERSIPRNRRLQSLDSDLSSIDICRDQILD